MKIRPLLAHLALATTLSCCTAALAAAQETPSYEESMQAARAAFGAGDWIALGTHLDAAQTQRPYSLYVTRNRILARALAGQTQDALDLAGDLAARGLTMDFTGHEALETLAASPGFEAIGARFAANATPRGDAELVLELEEPGLLPEAIAPAGDGYCIGSVRTGKILLVDGAGVARTVATAPGGVFDLEVRGDTAWAAVNSHAPYVDADAAPSTASVIVYDLATSSVSREVRVGEPDALLGDLELSGDHTVYASDSATPRLFRLGPDAESFEVFATDPRFANLQGIALDEARGLLFVADYLTGLFVVELRTAQVRALASATGAHLGGIDGLLRHGDALIGIQNGTTPQRIVRIRLDAGATRVVGFDVLQQGLAQWNEPTHGAVIGSELHYLATSNWPAYADDGTVREGARLEPLRVLAVGLDAD